MQQVTPAPGLVGAGLAAPGTALPQPVMTAHLRFICPVSTAVGTPRLHYDQILGAAQVPGAQLWMVLIGFIVQIVAWVFGEERVRRPSPGDFQATDGAVTMSLSELSEFMDKLKNGSFELPKPAAQAPTAEGGIFRPGVQVKGPADLTLSLWV